MPRGTTGLPPPDRQPFDIVELEVPVPGGIGADFYFWWNATDGSVLMKHNGNGGEVSAMLSDDYLSITNSSAVFGQNLGTQRAA